MYSLPDILISEFFVCTLSAKNLILFFILTFIDPDCFLVISGEESSKTAAVNTFRYSKHISQVADFNRTILIQRALHFGKTPKHQTGWYQHEIADREAGLNNM